MKDMKRAALPVVVNIREIVRERPLTEFEHAKFTRDARAVAMTGNPDGYAALGMLACLEDDLERVREFHLKAIAASGGEALQHHNYACSLFHCYQEEEAVEQSRIAMGKNPHDTLVLTTYIEILEELALYQELDQALLKWEKLTKEPHPLAAALQAEESKAAAALAEYKRDGGTHFEKSHRHGLHRQLFC